MKYISINKLIKKFGNGGKGKVYPDQSKTKLTEAQQIAYEKWKAENKYNETDDYDLAGYWKEEGFKNLSKPNLSPVEKIEEIDPTTELLLDKFYKTHPEVAGMSHEEGAVSKNPYSKLPVKNLNAVIELEKARNVMSYDKYAPKPKFKITKEQKKYFNDIRSDDKNILEYADAPKQIQRETIASRLLVGDKMNNANYTKNQEKYVNNLTNYMYNKPYHLPDKFKMLAPFSNGDGYMQLSDESKYASKFDKRGQGFWDKDKFIAYKNGGILKSTNKGWLDNYAEGGMLEEPLEVEETSEQFGPPKSINQALSKIAVKPPVKTLARPAPKPKPKPVATKKVVPAKAQEVPLDILHRQIFKESSFNSKAVSPAGAKGIAQIKKDAFKDAVKAGIVKPTDDIFDPKVNKAIQKFYMNNLYNADFINKPNQSEKVRLAKTLVAYNYGRGNLFKHLTAQKAKGVDIYNSLDWLKGLPKESIDYQNDILNHTNLKFEEGFKKLAPKNPYKHGGLIKAEFGLPPNVAKSDATSVNLNIKYPQRFNTQGLRTNLQGVRDASSIKKDFGKTGTGEAEISDSPLDLISSAMLAGNLALKGAKATSKLLKNVGKATTKTPSLIKSSLKTPQKSSIDWKKWNKEIPENTQLMNEYNAIEESTKKAGTWMKNPDGSPFQGTPEQFVQQNSENFKKAFGNSKLINPDGSPTIQYHGSAKKFDTFDESKFQLGDSGYSGRGIYTTPDKTKASSYALSSKSIHTGEYEPTVYELYGQGNNPISAEDLIKQNKDYDLFNFHRAKNWQGDVPLEQQMLDYDVAIRNQTRGIERVSPWNQAAELVFPTNKQLKSAIGNNGMFDMTNPNIYKAVIPGIIGAQQLNESKANGGLIKRADGSYSQKGLWDNIRANRGSGKEPTKEMLEQEKKINKKYPNGGVVETLKSNLNPYNWGVTDYTKEKKFSKAYEKAKKSGEEEFMWNNKRYTTKYAGTPRQEIGTYGINGKPINTKYIENPAQVNLYPAFGKYLPGHISASIGNNEVSVDYSPKGNYPYGINPVKNKGEKSFNVYGQDNLTFSNKAASLPTGDYILEDEYRPSDWNLFTNNCADNVCDAFGIPRSKGIQTPGGAMDKIKNKYPTLDITGRTYDDYYNLYKKLENEPSKKVLAQSKNILGIASSPDFIDAKLGKRFVKVLQKALIKEGYQLPKSKQDYYFDTGNYDGVYGPETKKALEDWNKKYNQGSKSNTLEKTKMEMGGTIKLYNKRDSVLKKLAGGGFAGAMSATQGGLQVADMLNQTLSGPGDEFGVRNDTAAVGSGALSGAAQGASMGSMFGPWGTAIGAVGGGVFGGIMAGKRNEEAKQRKEEFIKQKQANDIAIEQNKYQQLLASGFKTQGNLDSKKYAKFGGKLTEPPMLKETYSKGGVFKSKKSNWLDSL